MKCIAPLLLVLLLSFENTCAQDIGRVTISLDLQQATLKQALDSIEKRSPFRFTYKSADITGTRDIDYRQQNVSVKKVLDDLLPKAGLQYEVTNNYILIKKAGKTARPATLHGFVTAANSGESLIGATVMLSGSKSYATTTNAYGFYSLTVSPG